MLIHLIVGLIKKASYKNESILSKPFRSFGENINVKVNVSNYATEADIKNISHVDTSSFAVKPNLANLKTEVDKVDIEKLVTVPIDLTKVSNAVKNEVVKKTMYDKLVAKVNNIDTSGFVLKTKYDVDKQSQKRKFLILVSQLNSDYNAKISELENKIPSISGLVTTSPLTAAENRISSVSNIVKKTDCDTKISELEK